MSGCVLAKSTADIANAVSTVVKRNAAWNAVRAAEAKTRPAPSTVDIKKPVAAPRNPPAMPAVTQPRRAS
jgi:hypothetical protein